MSRLPKPRLLAGPYNSPPLHQGDWVQCGKEPRHASRLTRPTEALTLLEVACDDAAEAGKAVLRAVSLAGLLDGEGG